MRKMTIVGAVSALVVAMICTLLVTAMPAKADTSLIAAIAKCPLYVGKSTMELKVTNLKFRMTNGQAAYQHDGWNGAWSSWTAVTVTPDTQGGVTVTTPNATWWLKGNERALRGKSQSIGHSVYKDVEFTCQAVAGK